MHSSILVHKNSQFLIPSWIHISWIAWSFLRTLSIPIKWTCGKFIASGRRGNHPQVHTSAAYIVFDLSVNSFTTSSICNNSILSKICFWYTPSLSLIALRLSFELQSRNTSTNGRHFESIIISSSKKKIIRYYIHLIIRNINYKNNNLSIENKNNDIIKFLITIIS